MYQCLDEGQILAARSLPRWQIRSGGRLAPESCEDQYDSVETLIIDGRFRRVVRSVIECGGAKRLWRSW